MHKNKFYSAGLLFALLSLASCKKNLLFPLPESILTTSNAIKSQKDMNLAVLGIYSSLQARVQSDFQLMEMPSGNIYGTNFVSEPGAEAINKLSVSSDNDIVNRFWKATYNGIFLSNSVLANIDIPTDYTGSQKDQFTGEAEFLRAKFYFDLVRIFGGVPAITKVVTAPESKEIPRATEQEIYDLIVKDLQDAIGKLPDPSAIAYGRVSKGAAVALLGKVFVYLKDWDNAKIYLDQLYTDFSYSLLTDYAGLFKIETEKNSEAIFSVPYVSGTNGQSLTYRLAPPGGVYKVIPGGNGDEARPTWDLRKNYEDGDTRLAATITEDWFPFAYKDGDPSIWFPYFSKWIVPTDASQNSGLDIPLLRLGDMVLLDAEVLYNLNYPEEALVQLNRIRERAFGNTSHDYTMADISTANDFYDKLLLERRLELAVENNRWFDLVRTGRFTTALQNIIGNYNSPAGDGGVVLPIHAQPYMKYFPIPLEQIQLSSANVLTQNEGY